MRVLRIGYSSWNVNVPTVETQTGHDGWPEALGSNSGRSRASSLRAGKSDEQLARTAARGDVAAFETLFERHHRGILSFSRHMLGRAHDAEDVVQHTFLAADRAFRDGKIPKAVRAWLYTVARNRCVSLLRARREESGLPDAGVPSTENLVADVEQRDDLRALLGDLRALPDDQRAALLLSELGDLTHAEVADVIGVRAGKVKALVFQAREALLASAHARAIPCHSIREEIANASGAGLRRRHLKHHLAQCDGCRVFASDVKAQRAALAALLPVVPTVALRDSIFAGLASSGAAAGAGAGAGVGAGILGSSTAAKLLTTLAVGGAAAGGGIAVSKENAPSKAAEQQVERVPKAPAVVPAVVPPPARGELPTVASQTPSAPATRRKPAAERRDARRRERERSQRGGRADETPAADRPTRGHGRETAPGQLKKPAADAEAKAPKRNVPAVPRANARARTKAPKLPTVTAAPKPEKVKPAPPEPATRDRAEPTLPAAAPPDTADESLDTVEEPLERRVARGQEGKG
jgi:RNA polymerase sigma factor (sigma-70 family)